MPMQTMRHIREEHLEREGQLITLKMSMGEARDLANVLAAGIYESTSSSANVPLYQAAVTRAVNMSALYERLSRVVVLD